MFSESKQQNANNFDFYMIVPWFHFKAVTVFSTDRQTNQPTDQLTDKPSYRCSFPSLKTSLITTIEFDIEQKFIWITSISGPLGPKG